MSGQLSLFDSVEETYKKNVPLEPLRIEKVGDVSKKIFYKEFKESGEGVELYKYVDGSTGGKYKWHVNKIHKCGGRTGRGYLTFKEGLDTFEKLLAEFREDKPKEKTLGCQVHQGVCDQFDFAEPKNGYKIKLGTNGECYINGELFLMDAVKKTSYKPKGNKILGNI